MSEGVSHAPPVARSTEVEELKGCLRDLVSLTALPGMWTGQSQQTIVETMPDILVTTLRLQFAYVRLDRAGEPCLQAARWDGRPSVATDHIAQALQRWLFPVPIFAPTWIPSPFDDEQVRIVASQFAGTGLRAMVVAGARREPFPTENELTLIRVAGNQMQLALRNAKLLEDVRRAEEAARRASQIARDADRRKDEFLAMLGHELRNPLAPIVTALQLMRLRAVGSEREQTVIERQVQHLTRLVDDLLDISRITQGTICLNRHPIEVAAVVASAIETASPLFEQRRHHLVINVPRSGLVVHADAPRLTQVIANLLTNAGRYTPPGGRIEIRAARNADDSVTISISDNGIGIAEDLLPTIFDAFVQAKRSSDRTDGGLGLGLAIVRNLVQLHGGSVGAHSAGPGKGSEFTITLPLSTEEVEAHLATPASAATPTPERPLRVLIVDDNRDAADLLKDVIDLWGHEVKVAADGPSALALAESFCPDVGLIDIGLPVMDGYELAERLLSLPALSGIRLFALTGYGQPGDRDRTRVIGFHEHLVKPIDLDTLRGCLETVESSLQLRDHNR